MANVQELEKIASQVRRDIVRMVHYVNSGHPGGSLGCADFLTALYFDTMKRKKRFTMEAKGEDVFYLSNGHISPVFYSVLAHAGYFPVAELSTFRKLNSRLQGHPTTHEGLPGVRIASGSLGQGISVACGTALAKKMDGDDRFVFALTGDGELQEGQNWEAIMFAAHKKLDNLIVTVDWNGQQIDGSNDHVLTLGDLPGKFKTFGWQVIRLTEGNNMEEVMKTLRSAKRKTGKGKPTVILMNTKMGYGVDFMMNGHEWHGIAPNKEQAINALAQLEETLGDYAYTNDPLKN
jgi:transketolase